MSQKSNIKPSDYQGIIELLTDAILSTTDLTEAVQKEVTEPSFLASTPVQKIITGIMKFTNHNIKEVTNLVSGGLSQVLKTVTPLLEEGESSEVREAVLSVLNGVLGDYLAEKNNSLAIRMALKYQGKTLELNQASLDEVLTKVNGRVLLVVHGLCMNNAQWQREHHNHAEQLATDFGLTPIYLHYNTGKHISTNGQAFSQLLEELTSLWPVELESLFVLTHSMGGLVTRSACHYAEQNNHAWLDSLEKVFFLGTPHHGAPLEQVGNYIDIFLESMPYAKPFARLGKVRSAGIKDLRFGNILDSDWEKGNDLGRDNRASVALPSKAACYAIAGSTGKQEDVLSGALLGDGLVLAKSALGEHQEASKTLQFAPERKCMVYDCGHLNLLDHPKVYAQLSLWMDEY